jgi:hypothetical protein
MLLSLPAPAAYHSLPRNVARDYRALLAVPEWIGLDPRTS